MAITVPAVGTPTYQSWAAAVSNFQNSPDRVALWRNNDALNPGGGVNITYEANENPSGMLSGTSQIKATRAGLILVSSFTQFAITGPNGGVSGFTILLLDGVGIRRSSGIQMGGTTAPTYIMCSLAAIVPVNANQILSMQTQSSCPAGGSINVQGSRQLCNFEAVYLSA